jgi:hypothetical protein
MVLISEKRIKNLLYIALEFRARIHGEGKEKPKI